MGWSASSELVRLLVCAVVFLSGVAATRAQNVVPEVVAPLGGIEVFSGGATAEIDLQPHFRDPDVTGTAVRINFRLGATIKPVDVALFDAEKPITVSNFLAYLNAGAYDANFIHRSEPGFVIQGGGFAWAGSSVAAVPTFPPIQNEPGISNLRGTIAMAKLGGDANSATSQWFFNLNNNAANLDAQNGGFTVFGRVLGNGMAVADEVAALPRYNAGGPFTSLPLKDYTSGDIFRVHTVETSAEIIPALTYSAESSNPGLVSVSVSGSRLRLAPGPRGSGTGTAIVTVTATDLEGATTQAQLEVEVEITQLPVTTVTGASTGSPVPAAGSEGLPAESTLIAFGAPAISDDRSIAARVTIAAGRAKLGGIYFEDRMGDARLIARQGQDAGVAGAKFKTFRDPLLSARGAIAFSATLSGVTAAENEGVWTDLFGDLEPVLRKGAAVPGLGDLKLKSITSVAFDEDALLALVTLAPATAANDTALIRITGSAEATVLAREGSAFEGSVIKQISALQPAARSPGQGRWAADEGAIAKLTLANRRVVIARLLADGSQLPLLRTGAADSNLDATLSMLGLPAIGGESVAVLARQAKQAGVVTGANDSMLLFATDGETFEAPAREGAGAGGFFNFSDPVVNDQGQMLFYAAKRAESRQTSNVFAIWVTTGAAAPEIVAQAGAVPPGRDGLPLPDTTWKNFTSFALPDGLGAGAIFVAQVAGRGITGPARLGLWAVDSGGTTRLLLRGGEELTLPSGTKRVARFAILNSLPGSFGARRSYNATGSVAVQVTFTDRSQAVLRLDIP